MEQKAYDRRGYPLEGTVHISGAKNSAVALIPATILAESQVIIDQLPNISDVHLLRALLEEIGEKPNSMRITH